MLDPALLRTGRFDIKFELPLPDRESRQAIFEVHTRRKPVGTDVDIRELATLAEGKTGAEIEGVCRRAAVAAIREYLALHAMTNRQASPAEQRRRAIPRTKIDTRISSSRDGTLLKP